MQSPLILELIDALKVLPGVGSKSAQRMAYYLLERDRSGAQRLSATLQKAVNQIGHCAECRTLTELEICPICADVRRDETVLCVVETPADILSFESSGVFKGKYHVLMGHLSPIDGVGPEELGLDLLENRLAASTIQELIIATNPTVEGEVTAHYLQQISKQHLVKVTRLAQGIPFGAELEYLDPGTLTQAFLYRKEVDE